MTQRKDFTYASILELNIKYLRQIYDIHRKESLNEAKFAFYPEGPTWTITYDGETIRGLRGKGFQYLHYLVANQNKQFFSSDLALLDGVELEHINEDPEIKKTQIPPNPLPIFQWLRNQHFTMPTRYQEIPLTKSNLSKKDWKVK